MAEMRNRATRWTAAVLVAALSVPSSALAQSQGTSAPPPAPPQNQTRPTERPPDQDPTKLPPQNLDRIRKGLREENKLTIDENTVRFYVQVLAKLPSIEELIGDYDLMNGPTKRGAPMTHNEYLAMVTPREMYGSAGIKPAELLQFALVNWLGQAFVKKIVQDIQNARSESELREIRQRIDRELAALKGRQGGGGR